MTLDGSTLFGTTEEGGAYSYNGTVFSIGNSGGNPTTLCPFYGGNGSQPGSGLTLVGSTLYGSHVAGRELRYGIQHRYERRQPHDALLVQRQQR